MSEKVFKEKKFRNWYKDLKIDISKIIFSFFMAYSSVIVVVIILMINSQKLLDILTQESILFSTLGCCSSLLAVGTVKIIKNEMSFKLFPFLYNCLVIIPIFGFMSILSINKDFPININNSLLIFLTIIGVIISFYYVVINTNEERITRKKLEKKSEDLRKRTKDINEGEIGGETINV